MAAKKPRVIDLTADKNYPVINRYVKDIEATYVDTLKTSNIPMFIDIAKTKNALAAYFLNRRLYQFILGTNIGLLDRAMTSSIATAITSDIIASINNGKVTYPGIWHHDDVYSIVASAITIMKSDCTDNVYLTGHQYAVISNADLANLDPHTYMDYDTYGPNKFYQIIMMIRNIVIDVMVGIIKAKVPKAFISSEDVSIHRRMTMELGKFMKEDFDAADINIDRKTPANERLVNHFVEAFEKPFMVYYTQMLKESGLSDEAVVKMLVLTKINVVYNIENRDYGNIELSYVFAAPEMKNVDGEVPTIAFNTTINEMLDVVYLGVDGMSEGAIDRIGKKLRSLAINMCRYAVNIYINSIQEPATENINDEAADILNSLESSND